MIPESFIDEVLTRIDIFELISKHVALRKQGVNYTARCPFHTEKTASFTVNSAKQFYHCFGCGRHGDAIRFLMEYKGLGFVETIEDLAALAGLEVPRFEGGDREKFKAFEPIYHVLSEASSYYQTLLLDPRYRLPKDYLKARGLSREIIQRFSLGFAPPEWDSLLKHLGKSDDAIQHLLKAGLLAATKRGGFCDRFRNRVLFPIRDRRGRVIAFGGRLIEAGEPKYLNSPETPLFNKSKTLYGLYEARLENRSLNNLIVVEGYLDVVSLAQFGITTAVGTLGTALTEKHLERLFAETIELFFCFDQDKAGNAAMMRALTLCLPFMKEGRRVKFIVLPAGDDPDSFIHRNGRESFLKLLDNAQSLSDYFFDRLSNGCDLHHIDGRAELVRLAKPLLSKLPAGVYQQLMWEKLAELTHLTVETLKNEKNVKNERANPPKWQNSRVSDIKKSPVLVTPALKALSLILAHRELLDYTVCEQSIVNVDTPGTAMLCAIMAVLKKEPRLSLSAIMDRLPNYKQELAMLNFEGIAAGVPSNGVEAEFAGAIKRLKERAKEQAMEVLLMKAKDNILTPQEKNELMSLLKQKDEHWVE